jgi:hypothetical protein
MIARRLFRAMTRPIKRLARPLRLRYIDYLTKQSCREVERLNDMREDLVELERTEKRNQVALELRRNQIERGA